MTAPSFIARGSEGLCLLNSSFHSSSDKLNRLACIAATFSRDGSKLAVTTADSVTIYDPNSSTEIICLRLSGVVFAEFSPCGTYLQTFQRPSEQHKTNNVGIWDVKTGNAALFLSQKTVTKSTWPVIQFSGDEVVACRRVTNDVQIYDGKDFSKGIVDHLRLTGIESSQLATHPSSHIATYVPESKGQPAVVRIYSRADLNQPVARRSFFKSSRVQMTWNYGTTGLLVLAQSDDDKSNKSYYGESRLHYLSSDGSHEGSVPLNKEGPIHDAQWSPTGKDFIVVYGFMPAKATLFDTRCRPIFEFGSGPYNTVKWNPFGTFVCLAGFGNLPGDMAIWDRESLKPLGTCKSACAVTCEWSPDGRLLMTATTAPRMQVDNGIRMFNYTGTLLSEKKFEKLYQADWRPGTYVSRPPSPNAFKSQTSQKSSNVTASSGKAAAYRPPHSISAAAVKSELFGVVDVNKSSAGSKSALKNKKRREKKNQAKQEEGDDQQEENEEEKSVEAAASSPSPSTTTTAAAAADEIGKKVRALTKKLRQIEQIKAKGALSPQETEKVEQEISLIRQLESLQLQQEQQQ